MAALFSQLVEWRVLQLFFLPSALKSLCISQHSTLSMAAPIARLGLGSIVLPTVECLKRFQLVRCLLVAISKRDIGGSSDKASVTSWVGE